MKFFEVSQPAFWRGPLLFLQFEKQNILFGPACLVMPRQAHTAFAYQGLSKRALLCARFSVSHRSWESVEKATRAQSRVIQTTGTTAEGCEWDGAVK